MCRPAHRGLIVLLVLLCQVAAVAHVPAVHAATVGIPESGHTHCAEHTPPPATGGVDSTSAPDTHHPEHSGHPATCGCGCCQCPCAQAPALVDLLPVSPPLMERGPVTLLYAVPDVARAVSMFFRPPI